MALLLLIRHAPTPETGKRLTGRLPGVFLDEPGRLTAKATADRLASLKLKAVYTSPLERTRETADEIATPHRLIPIPHDGLIEVDYGRWSGRTLASLRPTKLWQTVIHTPSRAHFPGGESLLDVQRRGVATCEEVATRAGKATVALVTHGDVIKVILSHYLGQPLDLFQRLVVSTGSVSVLVLSPDGPPMVGAINGTGVPDRWR